MTKILSVSLPDDLPAELDAEAKRRRRSRSYIVAEAVRKYLSDRRIEGFDHARDLTLLDGLALDHSARARDADALWEEAWPFAPATPPRARTLPNPEDLQQWRAAGSDLLVVRPVAGAVAESSPRSRIASVCHLLNDARVRYVLVGGAAVILYGVVRATKDIDILIEATPENAARVLEALRNLTFGVAKDLDAETVANAHVTVVGDVPSVDIFTVAWNVRYTDAASRVSPVTVDGVEVPLVDIETLIRTKQTDRLLDRADVEALQRLLQLRNR